MTCGNCLHVAYGLGRVRFCNLVAEITYVTQVDSFVTSLAMYRGRTITMQQPPNNQLPTGNAALGFGLAIGIAIGTGLGVAMGNIALGTALGAAIGVIVGLALRQRNP